MKLLKVILAISFIFLLSVILLAQTIENGNDTICKKTIYISDEKIYSLPDSIFKFKTIRTIMIVGASYVDWTVISRQLNNFKQIDFLRISHCNLKELPMELSKTENIKTLDLRNNSLRLFPMSVSNMKLTQDLIISNNNLGSICNKDMRTLILSLMYFPELKSLSISENELEELPKCIVRLKRLRILDISHNKFADFPKVLLKMKSLHHIVIDCYPSLLSSDSNYLLKMKGLKVVTLMRDDPDIPAFSNEECLQLCKKYPTIQFMY